MSSSSRPKKERGRAISAISIASSRYKVFVLAAVLIITGVMGYGVTKITTDVDVADVLPRGDPNTAAAKNITAQFKSAYTQQGTVAFHTNPTVWQEDAKKISSSSRARTMDRYDLGAYNITDEVYVRAMEEFFTFVTDHTDGRIASAISVPGFYKLINWTVAGGEDGPPNEAAYRLPPSDPSFGSSQSYDSIHEIVRATIGPQLVDAIIDPSYDQATMLILVDPQEEMSSRDIGKMYLEARDAYNEWAPANAKWKVFTGDNTPLYIVDSPIANAHASALTQEDLSRLGPIILVFLLVTLYIAFRNTKSVLISGSTLVIGVVWTYGAMGYMGIPMNTLNLTVVPLIMGVGIDYTVHMVNEFLEHKAEGLSDVEAFRIAGGRAGFAMGIATLTTVIGLGVMMASPSLLLAQLGLLSAIAISVIYFLTLTFIPASLSLVRDTAAMGASFKPSSIMPAWGANVSAHRTLWAIGIVLVTFITLFNTVNLEKEAFGDPGSNFPESDPIRQEHERSLKDFYDTPTPEFKTNILVFEGDVTDPETHHYIQAVADRLATKASVNPSTLRHIVIGVDSWLMIRDGGESAVQAMILDELHGRTGNQEFDQYPRTKAEMEALIDDMFASPFRQTISLFIDYPDNGITTMTFAVKARTFEDAEQAWGDVWEAVEEAKALKPDDVQVAFVGNTATNFLFIDAQLPWLNYMSIVASTAAVFLVALFTRDLRATLTVGALMLVTTIWFMGTLPWIGVGLAITLMLPMVFIFNIGTDYAVHLVWNLQQVPNPREVFANVGKAILFSAITTIGAFAFFIPIRNVAMSKTMVATAISIAIIFVATMIIVALFYR
ncbi:MAG: MMPL family transporter, partial [Euryarchaeota archaeon]|nr:MMPL family transporter [Euryarchaeota archaeon]